MSRTRTALVLAVLATTLEAGLSYGHALQARGKRELPPEQLMHFQTRVLAPYRLGAGLPEAAAMATCAAATWGARDDRRTARRSAAALAATCAAFATWAVGIERVNRRLSTWDDGSPQQAVPPDWAALRDRWHRLHAARLLLLGIGAAAAASAVSEPAP